jgi:hypothetical protein
VIVHPAGLADARDRLRGESGSEIEWVPFSFRPFKPESGTYSSCKSSR